MSRKILSAEEVLAAPDLEEIDFPVPEWKGSIRLKSLSKLAHQQMRTSCTQVDGEFDLNQWDLQVFLHGVVEPKFTEEQGRALLEKNAGVFLRITRAIVEISGLGEGALKAAEQSFRGRSEPGE